MKLPVHFFLGLPLHRFPGIPSSYTRLASLSSSMCSTFHVLCLLLIVSTTASWLSLFFMVHVTSYLRKSDDFCGNPSRISVKVCAEICRFLWLAHRIVFRDQWNRLLDTRGFVLWESFERSLGDCRFSSKRNRLRESSNRCAISFERSAATLQRNIQQVCTEVPWIPSNVSADNLR